MNRPIKTEELIEGTEQFDKWVSSTLEKYLEEYMDYLEGEFTAQEARRISRKNRKGNIIDEVIDLIKEAAENGDLKLTIWDDELLKKIWLDHSIESRLSSMGYSCSFYRPYKETDKFDIRIRNNYFTITW